ncbi:MAG: hypothetical protein HY021_02175, partial [Burkholderiales bacterium]|nr:hypothetical protein [Burkholderiales bacterium]
MATWPWRGAVVPLALLAWAEVALHGVQSDALAPPSQVLLAWLALLRDGTLLIAST